MAIIDENLVMQLKASNDLMNENPSDEGVNDSKVEVNPEYATLVMSRNTPDETKVKSVSTSSEMTQKDDKVEKKGSSIKKSEAETIERPGIKAFVSHFSSNKQANEKLPEVLEIFQCGYRPKEKLSLLTPFFPGRLYTTSKKLYFLGPEKNFDLEWDAVLSIQKERGFMGSNNENDLLVSCRRNDAIISFVLCRFKSRDSVLEHLKCMKEKSEKTGASNNDKISSKTSAVLDTPQLPPVPPDLVLNKTEIVVSKTIKNASIPIIFEKTWNDRDFYDSFLRNEECFEITMEDWTREGEMRNEWCKEKYDQYRFVTFKFNRTTHLYIGPPIAFVKQKQYCRVEGVDKCVVAISAEFEGIPYSDSFLVEMRWVASRKGNNDIHIQVGLFVVFKKITMLKNQIKSGTIAETKNVHTRLFNAVKIACVGSQTDSLDKTTNANNVEGVDTDVDNVDVGVKERTVVKGNLFNEFSKTFLGYLNIPVIASSIGIIACLLLGRAVYRTNGNGTCQANFNGLQNEIMELRSEVQSLKKAIDLIAEILQNERR